MPEMFKRALIPELSLTTIKSASQAKSTILQTLKLKIAATKIQCFFRRQLAKKRRYPNN